MFEESADAGAAGNSQTPSFLRTHGNRSHSSPRRNGLSSKAEGKRRQVSSSPEPEGADAQEEEEEGEGDEEDEEEEEEVRKLVGSSKAKGGLKSRPIARQSIPEEEESENEDFGGSPAGGDDAQQSENENVEEEQEAEADEEEKDEEEEERRAASRKNKGKGRASQSQSASPAKRVPKPKAAARTKVTAANSRKRDRDDSPDEDGGKILLAMSSFRWCATTFSDADFFVVRRSHRHRVEPLEYWRNERVIYKRRQSGLGITDVVRVPKDPAESLVHRKRGGKRGPSQSRVKSEVPEEEGVDDLTEADGVVMDYDTQEEVTRRS